VIQISYINLRFFIVKIKENRIIKRTVYPESPVIVEYTRTEFSESLGDVIKALRDWGINHRLKSSASNTFCF
jgi:DNA-binding HxlR family transcriptional regulator